ncbi:hypothetical protein [Neisseria dentiae]|uniref:hypothetical protein n=1 Tax=Neisseria dentiae TaxID=194197 RepID=UPI000DFB56D8|nr:hypothetical protein [Neisseria dentiae]QMT44987.1 hypothetical protein H3L92_11360 [Neisseria dentiae]STZ50732.1 Uncharacterised protein [Neisseria dentiae]
MNLETKIDRLIQNIVLLQGKNDQRQKLIETAHWKAKSAMDEAGRSLGDTARSIKGLTAGTVASAVEKPLQEFEQGVEKLCREFAVIAAHADKQQREAAKRLKIFQWTAFAALAVAAVISIGSAVFMMKYARQEMIRSEWIADINNAVGKGKLSRCADGSGVCAKIKGKTVRLDK